MGKLRSTAFISFALPCTTVNAGGGVTAERTVPAGSPMIALLEVWAWESRLHKVPEGAFSEEPRVKLLRTLPTVKVPFPRPFSIMMSSSTLF